MKLFVHLYYGRNLCGTRTLYSVVSNTVFFKGWHGVGFAGSEAHAFFCSHCGEEMFQLRLPHAIIHLWPCHLWESTNISFLINRPFEIYKKKISKVDMYIRISSQEKLLWTPEKGSEIIGKVPGWCGEESVTVYRTPKSSSKSVHSNMLWVFTEVAHTPKLCLCLTFQTSL